MQKVLFLIHDLGNGGAEKVLVNLVNKLDRKKFDISVLTLFKGGVNEQYLNPDIRYRAVFPFSFRGHTTLMKLFTPAFLHRFMVKGKYDIEIAYLEGPSARIISGCTDPSVRKLAWIHSTMRSAKAAAASFRSIREAETCYGKMERIVFVSEQVRDAFLKSIRYRGRAQVAYNTLDTDDIQRKAAEPMDEYSTDEFNITAVGTLKKVKGFGRLLGIIKRLKEDGFPVHLYLLGEGPLRGEFEEYIEQNGLQNSVTLEGYQTNPYRYVARADLFVCSSYSEGFSTAATEALIVGTPVCTVEVSGMKELLGKQNEYGIIVKNDEEELYAAVRKLIEDKELLASYRIKAAQRGRQFRAEETVSVIEAMLTETGNV